jgi:hypothetical protein
MPLAATPYHAAQTDHRRILAALTQPLCDGGNLERAGHTNHVDAVVADSMSVQGLHRPSDELIDNHRVEAGRDQCKSPRWGGKIAFVVHESDRLV